MKKLIKLFLTALLIMSNAVPTFATEKTVYIEKISDDYYIEQTIEEISITRSTYRKTGTKTTKVLDSNKNLLWSVTVTGTFEYDGSHSTCTASSVSTACPASAWKITSSSATKSGSSATAKATGKRYSNGVAVETLTESVTLVCGSDGTLY